MDATAHREFLNLIPTSTVAHLEPRFILKRNSFAALQKAREGKNVSMAVFTTLQSVAKSVHSVR